MPKNQSRRIVLAAESALFYLLFLSGGMPSAFSQDSTVADSPMQAAQSRTEYQIGPADVLLINVNGLKEFSRRYYVSNSGKIHIPYLGIMEVNGLTTSKLQSEIKHKIREKDLLKEPVWVEVGIAESRAHSVYLLGEVMQPGQFALRNNYRISDLIFQGVGFNDVRSRYGYLYRRRCDATKQGETQQECTLQQAIKIDFKELLEGTHPEQNLQLQGGDILYVPERQRSFFYVLGDVIRAGSLDIPFDTQVLVSQAIALAGGPAKTAKLSKGLLLRYDETGARKEISVDFEAILKAQKPDFPVLPNDIIYIPGSHAKTLGYGLLNILPGIAMAPLY